jgi:hypothetical protein
MNKSKEIRTTQAVVKEIMEADSAARNSDDYLIFAVCKKINPICAGMPFGTVVQNRKNLGLPAFETIRRTAQKLRAAYPEYAGNSEVEAQRILNEETFRDYARKGAV